ncbi:WD40 repeat-like protein [Pluteus cervinus]|uniref:WD40 repeat-like protein n=1 Tax=Pluteus cervinus TaxID=181527 RepID=A0ACD3BEB2_9AGAR|nr:WD40 repeat-like protein [Pluteus cervinus]
MSKSTYELEREANIARNKALLEQLDMKQALTDLSLPKSKVIEKPKPTAKPVQPAKKVKERVKEKIEPPRRQSTRLQKSVVDPNETPAKKRKREAELEEQRAKEAEERLVAEEQERHAKRPRHYDLELSLLVEDEDDLKTLPDLTGSLQQISITAQPKAVADTDAFVFSDHKKETAEVKELREKLQGLKVVSRAKVTQNRVYSAAYHPDKTKDLIFFGDKHGQLGIWDARAAPEEAADEDGDVAPTEDGEGGKYWRLQVHWPATSKSSISSIKFNPIDAHSVYTTSYDCTVRAFDFTSGVSREVYSTGEGILPSSMDLPPTGLEVWISDSLGGLTHLDIRESSSKARRYELSHTKVGCVSVNPTRTHYLVTSSNSRVLQIWDTRKLSNIPVNLLEITPATAPGAGTDVPGIPFEEASGASMAEFLETPDGKASVVAEWTHDKSVSSAYWDPRGRSVVSTSYDDSLRIWEFSTNRLDSNSTFPSSRPFSQIQHNCQTGKWLTILRAQWTPNADVYPHFTIGNMNHSVDIYSCKGDLITKLSDSTKITAVQAVTCSHPNIVERVATGNGSGRCVLWAPPEADQ